MSGLLSLVLVSIISKEVIIQTFIFDAPSDTGAQPLVSEDGKIILAVNGEIYNHVPLRETFGPDVKFMTHSDCEVIIPLVNSSCIFCFHWSNDSNSTKNLIKIYAMNWTACSLSSS